MPTQQHMRLMAVEGEMTLAMARTLGPEDADVMSGGDVRARLSLEFCRFVAPRMGCRGIGKAAPHPVSRPAICAVEPSSMQP